VNGSTANAEIHQRQPTPDEQKTRIRLRHGRPRGIAGVAGTLACRSVSLAADNGAVGSDTDFDHFGVLGSRKALVGQAAPGTLLLVFGQIAEIFDAGQMAVVSPPRYGIVVRDCQVAGRDDVSRRRRTRRSSVQFFFSDLLPKI
jgi:hypothetical protein